jgi:hypothetical protein
MWLPRIASLLDEQSSTSPEVIFKVYRSGDSQKKGHQELLLGIPLPDFPNNLIPLQIF